MPFEELELVLNGKKTQNQKGWFCNLNASIWIGEKVINNIFAKFAKVKDRWFEFIDLSVLPDEMKEGFKAIIAEKLNLLA